MPASDLSRVALAAMRLQNGYALAIDTRDWLTTVKERKAAAAARKPSRALRRRALRKRPNASRKNSIRTAPVASGEISPMRPGP